MTQQHQVNIWKNKLQITPHNQIISPFYSKTRNNIGWDKFIHSYLEDTITVKDWVYIVVKEGILPMIRKKGYVFASNDHTIIECLLNYIYKHSIDYKKSVFTTYNCKHAKQCNYTSEYIENYQELHFPTYKWENLQHLYTINWLSDFEDFAIRIWNDIPFIIFKHINIKESPIIQEMNNYDEDYDSNDDKNKQNDTYLFTNTNTNNTNNSYNHNHNNSNKNNKNNDNDYN